jgi:hypothetical protein
MAREGGARVAAEEGEQLGLLEEGSKESTGEVKLRPEDNELECRGVIFKSSKAVWQVTIRQPLDTRPLSLIALGYGFLPFLVPALFVVQIVASCIRHHHIHLFPVYALLICVFCFILNEFILKPILKQPRPIKTANKYPDGTIKPGMPSGHVYNASALMVWLLCEILGSGPGYDKEHLPQLLEYLTVVLVLMAPVPWARVYNFDHTVNQCLVSSCLGLATGVSAFFVRSYLLGDWCEPWADNGWSHCPDVSTVPPNSTYSTVALGTHLIRGQDPRGRHIFAIGGILMG